MREYPSTGSGHPGERLLAFVGCAGFGMVDIVLREFGFNVVGVEIDDAIAEVNRRNGGHCLTADLLDIDPADYAGWTLFHFSPPCFPEGVSVLTDSGLIDVSEIKVGDMVLTHKGHYKKVTTVMNRQSGTILLEGLGHWGIQCTPNHPFLSSQLKKKYKPHKERGKENGWYDTFLTNPEWVNAEDMKGKHWLSLSQYPKLPIPDIQYTNKESARGQKFHFSLEFFKFAGVWVGDGWVRYSEGKGNLGNRGTVHICCGKHQLSDLEKIFSDAGLKYAVSEQRTTYRFSIYSRPLCRWLATNFGEKASGKTLPSWLLGATRGIREAFLAGYLFADGHKSHPDTNFLPVLNFSTVSRSLAISLRMLGLSLDYSVSVKKYIRKRDRAKIEGRRVNERPTYSIRFSSSERHSRYYQAFRSGLVRKISDSSETTVYDITVEDDHSFIADGIIVHNCPSFSVAKQGGETEIDLTLARKICEFIRIGRPVYFTLENVWGYRKSLSWLLIWYTLLEEGYGVAGWNLNAADYGVPQSRRRMIVIARRDGRPPAKPWPTHAKKPDMFTRPWLGWYEAIEDLIPGLPESQFAPWQMDRLPEELKTYLIMTANTNRGGLDNKPGRGILDMGEPANTVTSGPAGGTMPKAFLVPGDNTSNKTVRLADEPMATIQTRPPERCPHRAFLLGQSERSRPKSAGQPSGTVTANSNQTGIRAFVIDSANANERNVTIRDAGNPVFTVTAMEKTALPKAFIIGGQYQTPSDGSERTVQNRSPDCPIWTIMASEHLEMRAWLAEGKVVALTPRALARLQDFPYWFVLPENRALSCRGIGNALPPGVYRAELKSLLGMEGGEFMQGEVIL